MLAFYRTTQLFSAHGLLAWTKLTLLANLLACSVANLYARSNVIDKCVTVLKVDRVIESVDNATCCAVVSIKCAVE